jgi:tRNA/rRNA methyltransferase
MTGTTQADSPRPPAIVLVRPQLAVNIGTSARAMANFGLSDLRLVQPRDGWPLSGAQRDTAVAAASGAVHLLDTA